MQCWVKVHEMYINVLLFENMWYNVTKYIYVYGYIQFLKLFYLCHINYIIKSKFGKHIVNQ